MKKLSALCALYATIIAGSLTAFAQTNAWQKPYSESNATGSDVLALWHFDGNGNDASGNGNNLTLRGKDTHFAKTGKFGGALLVEENAEPGDKSQGAELQDSNALNPKGAFTLEMWISPSAEAVNHGMNFLMDKTYYFPSQNHPTSDTGYMLILGKSGEDKFTIRAQLGFGKDSEVVNSAPQVFEAGKWYHIAFTYDGKGGYHFYLGNADIGSGQLANRGSIAPSSYKLVIGDRHGSGYHRFHGRIDEVRILNKAKRFVSGKVLLSVHGGRTAFLRKEKDARLKVKILNDTLKALQGASIRITIGDNNHTTVKLPHLASGKSTVVSIPFDTNIRPAKYQVSAMVMTQQNQVLDSKTEFPLTIVSRPLPHQMPIIMWGSTTDYKTLTDIGYTGELVSMADFSRIWDNGSAQGSVDDARAQSIRERLDTMYSMHVDAFPKLNAGRFAGSKYPQYNRADKDGNKVKKSTAVDGLYPRIQKFSYDVGAAVAKTFDQMPAWKGALINTEVGPFPSFNEIDKKAYKEFSGKEIPQRVRGSHGVNYKSIPGFPADRIIADDNSILTYYKWMWTEGGGWNKMNSLTNAGLKSTGRENLFTWYDPAVRAPAVWGNGGDVNFINQWTYTYPNPIKVGLATDQLFAMAQGQPGQKVMNMIQIIWKRRQITDEPQKGSETDWEKKTPEVRYMSIAPDHLSIGTWLEFARPVKAIANHGWGSLGDQLGFATGSYKTTNVNTRKRMKYLLNDVIKPLAPTMLQVPGYPTKVAFLESFASQMFAGRGTYGWGGGWGADSYMVAQYAGLQPRIVYDQTILRDGLDQYKVLFMTNCDVLTESVAKAVRNFQLNGGIVIGDENLAPGIQPDILLNSIRRTSPKTTKQELIEAAQKLSQQLTQLYRLPLQSSNPNVLTHLRKFGNSNYVFTVNDNRTYGDYVGQYKKVMEKGLPSGAQITLNTMPQGSVYDLMNHQQVPMTRILGKVQFPVSLNGGEGNVFLVTPKPVGKLWVTVPTNAQRGKTATLKVQLNDNAGAQMSAVIPMTVTITDSKGRIFAKSGYYGAANGRLEIPLDIAPNDAAGTWQVTVSEALTGEEVVKSFDVK